MEKLDLVQGSTEWLDARLNHCCASEAPAMMNVSKYVSRKKLLDVKKGWKEPALSSFKEKLFAKGHESEDSAREITQLEYCEDFPPVVGLREVEGIKFLASFDGLEGGKQQSLPWEHKEFNEKLAENVRNTVLEPHYYWQLEHQALVADYPRVLFTCSDGTEDRRVSMIYHSVPERRAALIAGWKQFLIDLEGHEIEAKQELIVAQEVEALPAITFKMEGTLIVSNIKDCLPIVKDRAEQEMNRVLETEQDFTDKDAFNKATKAARVKLNTILKLAEGEFESWAEFSGTVAEFDTVLQKMQSAGEKQVTKQKKEKKEKIIADSEAKVREYTVEQETRLKASITLDLLIPDFFDAMKGKRVGSWQGIADDEIANIKSVINQKMERFLDNIGFIRETAADYKFLFNDLQQIIDQASEPFQAVVKSRIADHKAAEEKRLEADRDRIREEEEAKATKKAADELAAKEKAKQEQQADHDKKAAKYNAEQAELSVDSKDYTPPKSVEPAANTVLEERCDFVSELVSWSNKYDLSLLATEELEDLLKNHGVWPK
ncbi:MAG: YqaJ viral recombinase family protein [Nitrosomonadaceae bacterium]